MTLFVFVSFFVLCCLILNNHYCFSLISVSMLYFSPPHLHHFTFNLSIINMSFLLASIQLSCSFIQFYSLCFSIEVYRRFIFNDIDIVWCKYSILLFIFYLSPLFFVLFFLFFWIEYFFFVIAFFSFVGLLTITLCFDIEVLPLGFIEYILCY